MQRRIEEEPKQGLIIPLLTPRQGRDFAPFRGEEEFLLLDLKRAYSILSVAFENSLFMPSLANTSIPQVPMEVPCPLLGIFLYYIMFHVRKSYSCPTSLSVGESTSAPVLLSLGPSNKS